MSDILTAVILIAVLQKLAAVLFIPVILFFFWCKGRSFHRDSAQWDRYLKGLSNRSYVLLFFASYSIPLALMSAAGYALFCFLGLNGPLILAFLTFLFGILKAVRKLDDHKQALWDKLRKFA